MLGMRHLMIGPLAGAQVGVSLVLSFMVVWDLPAISAGISSLQTSRLAPFYNEVAPSLAVFGQLFGKALQAQARPPLPSVAATVLGVMCVVPAQAPDMYLLLCVSAKTERQVALVPWHKLLVSENCLCARSAPCMQSWFIL